MPEYILTPHCKIPEPRLQLISKHVFLVLLGFNSIGSDRVALLYLEPIDKLTVTITPISQEPADAKRIVNAGMTFLQSYAMLATLAYRAGRPLWTFRPKIHYFHHILLDLHSAAQRNVPQMNVLAASCSASEDFIGRTCLVSRRVAATTAETRVLQRWLAGAMGIWNSQQV